MSFAKLWEQALCTAVVSFYIESFYLVEPVVVREFRTETLRVVVLYSIVAAKLRRATGYKFLSQSRADLHWTSVEQLLESIDKLLNVSLSCITLQHDIELDIYTTKSSNCRQSKWSKKNSWNDRRKSLTILIWQIFCTNLQKWPLLNWLTMDIELPNPGNIKIVIPYLMSTILVIIIHHSTIILWGLFWWQIILQFKHRQKQFFYANFAFVSIILQ